MTEINKPLSIAEIKKVLQTITDPTDERLEAFRLDSRKGALAALNSWERKVEKQRMQEMKLQEMLAYEKRVWSKGKKWVAGIDEVGRGPLAGPVVSAAVILPEDFNVVGINDSKQLSLAKRDALFEVIQAEALAIGIGIKDSTVIDQVNIYEASKLAMIEAVERLKVQPDHLLIDAMTLPLSISQESIIKGDAKSVSIAAASIIAKVTRDRMMEEYDTVYPGYGFSKNAGYGTKEHLNGLDSLGVTAIHRHSFAPVREADNQQKSSL
ncbi:ribonuclease HII [Desemzia sp. RIT804]|uniref:ribonuclease HII n=1 Tax=Desemzia sp. RIT 804 TaxID=2810209 RepID=UPI00194F1469|nr:ribonuclease HII [Desemzia sp. RIT 804]MBM6613759.1 ribonuclease HII [Desemzia sp. RIT 804]